MAEPGRTIHPYSNDCLRHHDRSVWWIWDGVVAEQAVTLLSAPEKLGKMTLLSLLLDRRREGGQLLGREVHPGRTMLCSEEEQILWALRQPPLDFGPRLEFHGMPPNPTRRRWRDFIDHLLDQHLEEPYTLLVIDTVMSFLPAAQNNPRRLRWALEELRVVAGGLPTGVLLLHQASAARSGHRARGPLRAFADILIDMDMPPGDRFARRRHLYGVGRYPGTLQYVAAELNAEGTDYRLLSDGRPEAAQAPSLETLCRVLRQSAAPLTRQEIIDRWPEGEPPPRADSLWRSLARGCQAGILIRSGEGTKVEAFRYGLAPSRPDP
jgi:hypothetical protein